jgi:hypothetical protein
MAEVAVKKKFTFRFVISCTHEITLTEDQIYPDYPWRLHAEHAHEKKKAKLTAAHVMKTVRAHGGPDAVLCDWNLGPEFVEGSPPAVVSRRVRLSIRPASRKRKAVVKR